MPVVSELIRIEDDGTISFGCRILNFRAIFIR